MPKYMSIDAFRTVVQEEGLEAFDAIIQSAMPCEVKGIGNREISFVISTDTIDRGGDTVSVEGWDFERFLRNPVVLWAHDASSPPIARALDVRVEGGALKATAKFRTPVNAKDAPGHFADSIYHMLKDGFLSAVSVGFVPKKWSFAEGEGRKFGIDFEEQELLEFSVVPVPANPDALIEARNAGFCAHLDAWARKILNIKQDDAVIDRSRLQQLQVDSDELTQIKAARLVSGPEPVGKFPRLIHAQKRLIELQKH